MRRASFTYWLCAIGFRALAIGGIRDLVNPYNASPRQTTRQSASTDG